MKRHSVVGAAACMLLAMGCQAEGVEFSGYFRSGAGSADKGGNQVCYRLPGSVAWFRLGNECDTYAALSFGAKVGEVDGTTFKAKFTTAYGTQQMANWEQTTPAFREAYVEAQDIGAGLGLKALQGATLWAGKRFYKNPDIHMIDYTYWEVGMGPGFGLDNVDVGAAGKFSYAMFRVGDFTGYGINTNLGGYNPDLIGGGTRTATVHDFRLQGIKTNDGGSLTLGLDLVRKNNRDGTSTYTTQRPTQIWVDTNGDNIVDAPITVVQQVTHTVDNTAGKNGAGVTITHKQENFLGLGGFHEVGLQLAHNAAAIKGFGFAGTTDKSRKESLIFSHWVMEPKNSAFTASATAGLRRANVTAASGATSKIQDVWVGIRPQYHINNIWSLMSEVGVQAVKPDGGETRRLSKLTVGTQFSMGRSVWSRPTIRFFATKAKWNDAAAAAGAVACSGRDCGNAADGYGKARSGLSYGVQAELWL